MKRLLILLTLAAAIRADEPKPKPQFQYKSEGIEVPAATADEPRVKAFGPDTIAAAAKYLDDGAHQWVREKSCIACHSTGVYMVERSALTQWLGKPSEEVLRDFIDEVPKEGGKPDASPIKSVWRSSGLASWDKHVAGKLSEHTDRSLRHTLTLLGDAGFFLTIKQVEIPYITTHFELTVQAARAIATAPGWLANLKDADVIARIERMKKFLREHEPVNDYELAMKLRLSTLMPELVLQDTRDAATAMLWRQQQPDGGWSTRRMSDLMKWHEKMDPKVVAMIQGEPDAANPASDAYMTAFAIVLLRESGVPASDARIRKGVAWLKANQRVSGRWWMKSLFRDTYHYITYISTAQALRALALCGEVPAAPASPQPAPPIASAGVGKGLRVFTCGHSFHVWVVPMLSEMALSAGIADHVVAGKSSIGGSTVMRHWDVPDDKNLAKQALRAGKVDVLTLSPIWLPEEGIGKFAALAFEHNANIRVTVQEYWLPNDEYNPVYPLDTRKKIDHNTATMPALRKAHEQYFHDFDEHARGINNKLGKDVVLIVPAGQAVLALREKIIAGEVPALKTQAELFRDNWGHPTVPVQVLAAYCHFAVIYKRSPVGLPLPTVLAKNPAWDEKLNRLLQELAWNAVTKHPMSGVRATAGSK